MSIVTRVLVLGVLSLVMTSCDPANPGGGQPSAPSPVPTTPQPVSPPTPFVFREPGGFSTTDLLDANGRIVQFNSIGELVLLAEDAHFPGYEFSWDTNYWGPPTYFIGLATHVCADFCVYSVRFGSEDGQRHAYLTIDYGHSNPGTMVTVEDRSGALVATQTSRYPPGSPTLSGVVTEMSLSGPVPIAGASVSRSVSGGWQSGVTDAHGVYHIFGLVEDANDVVASKSGYQAVKQKVTLNGDTRLDIQITR
jgi:hypothetical protein